MKLKGVKVLEKEANAWTQRKHSSMQLDDYQENAKKTAIYAPEHMIMYPALGLAGEAGEVANKVKKIMRDGVQNLPPDWKHQLASEIGDVLWYCAVLASDLNVSLGTIAAQNIEKLERRKRTGTLQGSGDKR